MSVADVFKITGMSKCKVNMDRGSSTVEMSIILPVIIFITVLIIQLHLGLIDEGKKVGDTYNSLYSVSWDSEHEGSGYTQEDGYIWITVYPERISYKTEFDKCSSRLRRWQLYGDVLCE